MKIATALMLSTLLLTPPVLAAGGPDRLNYQGVLRDASGVPRQGTFDMRFRFFDAAAAGNELLIDEHLAAGTGGVVVTGGLFNTPLGGGNVLDGSSPGVFGSITEVVGQFETVWLEIQVAGETLTPRVAVLSSAYAMNARLLQGKDASQFLDTSGATQVKAGLLVANGGVDFGPGTSDDLSAADVSALTGGGSADGLHTHSLVANATNANTLDSLDSSQFLRSDTSDTYTSGILTMAPGTALDVNGDLWLNGSLLMDHDGPDGAQALYFFNSGEPTGASIQWDDVNSRFSTSHGLYVNGVLRTQAGAVIGGNQVTVGSNGPDQDQIVAFYEDGNPQGEYLQWDNSDDLFHFSDDVRIGGVASINGSSLSLGAIGAETTQSLYFFEAGLATGESIAWDDAQDRFEVSDELVVANTIRTGSVSAASVGYNTIGSGTPLSADITGSTDLYVAADLEVGSQLYFGATDYLSLYPGGGSIYSSGSLVAAGNLAANGTRLYLDWDTAGNAWLEYQSPATQFVLTKGLDINGTMSADTKNFVQNHPTDKDLSIVYTTLEGPEASVFTRGSGRLENGIAHIKLDETFAWVAHPDLGLTASLTPRGEWSNLYVESLTPGELVVRAAGDTAGDAAFDYLVLGLRVGYVESPVVQPKKREAMMPRVEEQREAIASRPDLARHTPLAHYQQMSRAVTGHEVEDFSKGEALRLAIGVNDPSPTKAPGETARAMGASGAERNAGASAGVPKSTATVEAAATAASSRRSFEDSDGNLYARSFRPNSGGLDAVAPAVGTIQPGDVLTVDPSGPGVRRAELADDVTVVGIATGASTVDREGKTTVSFAVAGIVTCNVDAALGAVRAGDLLVSSPNSGFAMRGESPAPGSVVGKALEPLASGTGVIRVLVGMR